MTNVKNNAKVESPVDSTTGENNRLRGQIADIMGVDRWVEADYPTVAPVSVDEVILLFKGYPGIITIVGVGTNFPANYSPTADVLTLLTGRLVGHFEHSALGCTIEVSAGWQIKDVRARLAQVGQCVPSLDRFERGTIGGRLAAISSYVEIGRFDGWNNYLLGLEIITSDGEFLKIGGRSIKDVAGYNLKSLFTGSRGAIGMIASAIFRTKPLDNKLPVVERESQNAWSPSPAKQSAKYDPALKRLFDPRGRMRPGP